MNVHEFQAKSVLSRFGLPILPGHLCYSPGQAEAAADQLGACPDKVCVVKAQIHAGGRGKAGGVKIARSPEEARQYASAMLGSTLVTPQTGSAGKLVRKVYVEAGCHISREFYVAALVDRSRAGICFVVSREGGMEIEEVARLHPERVMRVLVEPAVGLQAYHCRALGRALELSVAEQKKLSGLLDGMYQAFIQLDLALLEVNPLVLTDEDQFVLLDAKVVVDDNALFRQAELCRLLDYDEMDPRDLRASKVGVSYVGLDGDIGCMVNGAGLAMATMDIIQQHGGSPANFLDVGGGASRDMVREAFKILVSDTRVKGILVHIFGGIMRCDLVAEGVVEAARDLAIQVPVVVRLQGTNVEKGRSILAQSGLPLTPVASMEDAGREIVRAVQEARR